MSKRHVPLSVALRPAGKVTANFFKSKAQDISVRIKALAQTKAPASAVQALSETLESIDATVRSKNKMSASEGQTIEGLYDALLLRVSEMEKSYS